MSEATESDETLSLDDPTAVNTLSVGQIVAGHRIERLLGSGGFGAVFQAQDLGLKRAVAFKVLRSVDDTQLARFRDEAVLLARLNDPHIVQIHRVGRLPTGEPFLVMELFGDGSLDARYPKGRKATLADAVRYTEQVLAGLDAAHQAGVVHRDIKGANVLVEGPTGRVKLCDFGIARAQDGDNEAQTGGVVLGTPHYIAPERLRGVRDDPRSDLYSVGVLLYRLLTGQRPFDTPGGISALGAVRRAMLEPPPSPQGVPAAMARVCQRLLQPDPELRFPTAEAALDALRAAQQAEPTGPLPAEAPPAVDTPPAHRARGWLALGAASALALAVALWGLDRAAPAAAPAPADVGPGTPVRVSDAAGQGVQAPDATAHDMSPRAPDASVPAGVAAPATDTPPVARPVRPAKPRPRPPQAARPTSKAPARLPPTAPATRPPPPTSTAVPAARGWFDGE